MSKASRQVVIRLSSWLVAQSGLTVTHTDTQFQIHSFTSNMKVSWYRQTGYLILDCVLEFFLWKLLYIPSPDIIRSGSTLCLARKEFWLFVLPINGSGHWLIDTFPFTFIYQNISFLFDLFWILLFDKMILIRLIKYN